MVNNEHSIYVYAGWGPKPPARIGCLYTSITHGKELHAFSYDREWLHAGNPSFLFDPDLSFFEGRQYAPLDKRLFGVFSDSCPDRWGRMLMNRKESILARNEGRKPRALTESDYLLGVFDEARLGGLRFSMQEGGPFLSADADYPIPPWAGIRTLESASLSFESDENGPESRWLHQLLAPGSSLGGARPKASIYAPDGSLWIAKFPSKHDEWNAGAWEMVVHDLAVMCGLNVPEAALEHFSDKGSTFLVKRFDREGESRVHFSSAMALLGKTDSDSGREASYLDIASFIKANGAAPDQDLYELWRRVVFSIAVSNTDDHLRNHGFLLTGSGWRLSPLYDVNPNIYGDTLSLYIDLADRSMRFVTVIDTAPYYHIPIAEAVKASVIIREIVQENWRRLASHYGLGRDAIHHMEPAFAMSFK